MPENPLVMVEEINQEKITTYLMEATEQCVIVCTTVSLVIFTSHLKKASELLDLTIPFMENLKKGTRKKIQLLKEQIIIARFINVALEFAIQVEGDC